MSDLHNEVILPRKFYRDSTKTVARNLLGRTLVSNIDQVLTAGRIVEVEAYLGSGDAAAHSANGPTPRTRIQWGPPGNAYVYLIYGMYCCLNFVTEPEDTPGCVLIRAIKPVLGLEHMKSRRKFPRKVVDIGNGPGKLTQALGISRDHNGADLTRNPLYVSDGSPKKDKEVAVSPRIGIRHAAELPLRFFVRNCEFVTKHAFNRYATGFAD